MIISNSSSRDNQSKSNSNKHKTRRLLPRHCPANTPQRHQVHAPRVSKKVFSSSLKHTLDKINWANFGACYPTIATHAPGTLQAVQQQMVRLLGEKSNVRLLALPSVILQQEIYRNKETKVERREPVA